MEQVRIPQIEPANPFARSSATGSWYDYRSNILWLDSDAEVPGAVARHEMSHFLLHASTPYGVLLEELGLCQRGHAFLYCRDFNQLANRKTIVPGYDFALQVESEPSWVSHYFADPVGVHDLLSTVFGWTKAVHLERVLEGEDLSSVRSATQPTVLKELLDFERSSFLLIQGPLFDGDGRFDSAGSVEAWQQVLANQPGLYPACPTATWGPTNETYPLGGTHIFETMAQFNEGWDEEVEARLRKPPVGQRYFSLFIEAVMRLIRGDAGSSNTTNPFPTLIAVCELALFVPAGWLYGRLRPVSTSWYDLQPAFRLRRALDIAAQVGLVTDLKEDMTEFQETICKTLGWVRPAEFLSLALELDPTDHVYRRHRDAASIRISDPTFFLQPDHDSPVLQQYLVDHGPMYHSPNLDRLQLMGGSNATEMMSPASTFMLQRLWWNAMRDQALDWEGACPPGIYDGTFANITSKDDLIDLFVEAIPDFHPSRFQSLRDLVRNAPDPTRDYEAGE